MNGPFTSMYADRDVLVLDEGAVRAMFEFTSGQWSTQVYGYDQTSGIVDGSIMFDGERIGSFMRMVDTFHRTIVHVSYGLDADYQRRGFTRAWYEHCMAGYRAAGFERVTVHAGSCGRVAWAKLGFEATPPEWHRTLDHLTDHVSGLAFRGDISGGEAAERQGLIDELRAKAPSMLALLGIPFDAAGTVSALESLDWRGVIEL